MTCILHGCIREYYSILLSDTISPMGMSKEMKLWFYLKYPCSQRSVSPMRTIRFIKNHHWRFVSNKHIYIVRYHILGMIVCQAVEFHTVNHAFPVLQEIDIIGQVLYIISIPQANVVIANYEYLMPVRQLHIPINEVEHLALLTIIADVTAMHDNISLRQVIKLMVSAVSVRYMYDFHLSCSDIYWQLY